MISYQPLLMTYHVFNLGLHLYVIVDSAEQTKLDVRAVLFMWVRSIRLVVFGLRASSVTDNYARPASTDFFSILVISRYQRGRFDPRENRDASIPVVNRDHNLDRNDTDDGTGPAVPPIFVRVAILAVAVVTIVLETTRRVHRQRLYILARRAGSLRSAASTLQS